MVSTKLSALAAALVAASALADVAAATPAQQGEDITYLFQRSSEHAHAQPVHHRRQAASSSVKPFFQGGPAPAAGATSVNGKPYPAFDTPRAPGKNYLPDAWVKRYNDKKAAGLIPNISPSTASDAGISYPSGTDTSKVCNWSLTNCFNGDLYMTPDKVAAVTFDDGPTEYSHDLVAFLAENKQASSHFLIGYNILNSPDAMKSMINTHDLVHLGVHTFSHSLQSSKTDLQILADLGWTMQLIYEYTGKIPMYWRPPEGDLDNRVRAIAKEVLGMTAVMWNRDADDWCLKDGGGTEDLTDCKGTTFKKVTDEYKGWANNASAPGINTLMHETKDQTIAAFKEYYWALGNSSVGYKPDAVPDIVGLPWYQNQFGYDDKVEDVDTILPTRQALNITDGGLHKVGDPEGPSLGDYSTLAHESNNSSSGSPSASSSASSAAASATGVSDKAGDSKSGAASLRPLAGLALAALVPAALFL